MLDADIRVIVGPGAADADFPEGVEVLRHVRSMAAEMLDADLILTSAGRTVYEAAAVGTPVAVLAQGARDATHSHLQLRQRRGVPGHRSADRRPSHRRGGRAGCSGTRICARSSASGCARSIDGLGAARIADRMRAMLKGI